MEPQNTIQPEIISPVISTKATTPLVLGIIGMIAWFIPIIGLPVTIVGLVKGIKASPSTKRTASIVLCIIGLVLTIINGALGAYTGAMGENPVVNKILK